VWCFVIGAAWAAPLTVDDVVRRALESSPAAVAAEAELDALRGLRRSRSIFLQNPNVEIEALGGDVSGEAIQPLSLLGEGWAARSEARALTDAAEASRTRARLEVAARARTAWAEAVLASARADAAGSSLELAARLRAAVDERARVGDASALDAALARAGEAGAVARSLEARRARTAALSVLAGFHPDAIELGVAGDADTAVPTATTSSGARSDVDAMTAIVDARAADLRRERSAAIPAVGVGVVFDGDGNVGPKGVLEVPLWARNQDATGEARKALASAVAELEVIRAVAAAEQRLSAEQAEEARSVRTRLDGFDDQSEEALGFAALAYERGELGVQQVVLLQNELLEGRLAAFDALALAIAMEIEALLAVEDPSLLGGGAP
jgi:outer membrane protein TolC